MQEISARSADGHGFTIRFWSQDDALAPLVVICPAMGVQGRYYCKLAETLHLAGLQVASFDLRGQGSSSLRAARAVDWGYDTLLTQDFPALLTVLRQRCPQAPLFFWGHSQGGQLACLYLAREPGAARGIVLTACGTVYYRGWPFPQSLKILGQTQLLRGISQGLGYLPGDKLGFAGRQARSEISDWANNALTGKYILHGSPGDDDARLQTLTAPVWAYSFAGDNYAPEGATAYLLGKMPKARSRHEHLGPQDMPHEALHHFYWARQPQTLVDKVLPLLRGGG